MYAWKTALARYYFKMHRIDTADKMTAEILKVHPNDLPTRLLKSEILLSKNDFIQAVDLLNQLAEEETESDRVQFLMALAHSGRGDATQAKAKAARALELNPRNVQAHILLADLHYREGNFAVAEKESLSGAGPNPFQHQDASHPG